MDVDVDVEEIRRGNGTTPLRCERSDLFRTNTLPVEEFVQRCVAWEGFTRGARPRECCG